MNITNIEEFVAHLVIWIVAFALLGFAGKFLGYKIAYLCVSLGIATLFTVNSEVNIG